MIESKPGVAAEIEKKFGFKPDFENAKYQLEKADGAGNTFKATAKACPDRHGRLRAGRAGWYSASSSCCSDLSADMDPIHHLSLGAPRGHHGAS